MLIVRVNSPVPHVRANVLLSWGWAPNCVHALCSVVRPVMEKRQSKGAIAHSQIEEYLAGTDS